MLHNYQTSFLSNIKDIIGRHWLRRRPHLKILDMGCEPGGHQLKAIAELTSGEVFGINVPENFPSPEAITVAGDRVRMLRMDGMNLEFEDSTFDLVISANVIEHAPNPDRFISEAARVLKPDGLCFIETAPVWTSARGHHIMEMMVAENCPQETAFIDDGSVIPEWAHLNLSRDELERILAEKLQPETVQYILWYLYDSNDLCKQPWSSLSESFHRHFPHMHLMPRPLPGIDLSKMPADGREDYLVYGFKAVGRKRALGPVARRLYWRLRKLGL